MSVLLSMGNHDGHAALSLQIPDLLFIALAVFGAIAAAAKYVLGAL